MDMTPEEGRVYDIWDQVPEGGPIWAHGDELDAGHFTHTTWEWWREALGHPRSSPTSRYCKTCGATGCLLASFYDAVVVTSIRELYRVGWFREPERPGEPEPEA